MSSSSRNGCAQGNKHQFMKVSLFQFSTQDILDQDKADTTHSLRIPNEREGEDNFRPPCTCVCKLPLRRTRRGQQPQKTPGQGLSLGRYLAVGEPSQIALLDFHLCPKRSTQGKLGVPGPWAG